MKRPQWTTEELAEIRNELLRLADRALASNYPGHRPSANAAGPESLLLQAAQVAEECGSPQELRPLKTDLSSFIANLKDAVSKHLRPMGFFVAAPVLPAGLMMTGAAAILLFSIAFVCYLGLSWVEWTAVWTGKKATFNFKELFRVDRGKLDALGAVLLPIFAGYGCLVLIYHMMLYLRPPLILYPFIVIALMLVAGLVQLQAAFQLLDQNRRYYSYEDVNLKRKDVLAVVAMGQSINLIAVMIVDPVFYCLNMAFNPCAAIAAVAISVGTVLSSFSSLHTYKRLRSAK